MQPRESRHRPRRPIAARSCDSKSCRPSVGRQTASPATALSRMWLNCDATITRPCHAGTILRRRKSQRPAFRANHRIPALVARGAEMKCRLSRRRRAGTHGSLMPSGRFAGDRLHVALRPRRERQPGLLRAHSAASIPGRATHIANTNGSPVHWHQRLAKSQTSTNRPAGRLNCPVADQQYRVGVASIRYRAPIGNDSHRRLTQANFFEQNYDTGAC